MIFGKIDYINLLPLHVYLKKYPLPNAYKASMEYKKGVPSKLNKDLFYRRIDAAIISSIESVRKKYKNLDLGICANKKVLSVLVEKNTLNSKDPSSASSNALAKVLKQNGRVIIGDKALQLYLKNPSRYIDLCEKWHEKTGLPFVFARFSCVQKKVLYEKIFKKFLKTKVKLPYYIMQNYAKTRNLDIKDLRYYLDEVIYYKISTKEKMALKRFIKYCKALN
ncbi:menaquinone via futalosine step 1 [Campylobacter hepaticus]|nr:MqnA/MqnD/SBP family protein [Campylobacter hepaticus]AXP08252.1 menaquinone via futalosine step 1 [Campylobacter hepaticus]MCZ0772074.1 menaquinone via futalosine step 1 [Campylobacter hepaticus]MCZ0773543.1 menaquinone via futalosine step 1 [Campylobacter hepaticus]MCZ0774793.1 menaquinone via futalosine step 1 [Campylobacter hepaticus]MPV53491.1 menaquinone via futalosine step 1 [Campylobacter hepaticus]